MTADPKIAIPMLAGYAHGLAIMARREAQRGQTATVTLVAYIVEQLAIAAGRSQGVVIAADTASGGSMLGIY